MANEIVNAADKTVLAVDDDKDILALVQYALRSEGYRVLIARDGEQALKTVREQSPDLIVMDVMMPEISGFQVLRQIKEDEATQAIPVIMLTAKDEESDILSGWLRGADLYMTKPFDPWELIANINRVFMEINQSEAEYS